jgi:hypothetical protein
MPAPQNASHRTTLSSVPAPATITFDITILSDTQRTILMTMTSDGTINVNATCVRLSANLPGNGAAFTEHVKRLCTATNGGTGTITLRFDAVTHSTGNPFIFNGSGRITAGTGDFANLHGSFSVVQIANFGNTFPEHSTEKWTGTITFAPGP